MEIFTNVTLCSDSHAVDESDDWVGSAPLVHFFWQRLEGNEGDYYGMGVAGHLLNTSQTIPKYQTKLCYAATVPH